MEAREERRPDRQDLGVELRGSGHGRSPGQENHSLCSLRMGRKQVWSDYCRGSRADEAEKAKPTVSQMLRACYGLQPVCGSMLQVNTQIHYALSSLMCRQREDCALMWGSHHTLWGMYNQKKKLIDECSPLCRKGSLQCSEWCCSGPCLLWDWRRFFLNMLV